MQSGLESTSSRNYGAWVTSRQLGALCAVTRTCTVRRARRWNTAPAIRHLLSAILTQGDGQSTWQFAQGALAKPLGFSLAQWPQDPQGVFFGGNDMLLTPRQMVAFGELYLNRGRAGAMQVLPERGWSDSFVPRGRSNYSDQMYGYGWWMRELAGQQAYYAWGFGGQYIFVIPVAAAGGRGDLVDGDG